MSGQITVEPMSKLDLDFDLRSVVRETKYVLNHDTIEQLEAGAFWSVISNLNEKRPQIDDFNKSKLLNVLYNQAVVHPNLDLPRPGVRRGNSLLYRSLCLDSNNYFGDVLTSNEKVHSELLTRGVWEALGLADGSTSSYYFGTDFLNDVLTDNLVDKLNPEIDGISNFKLNAVHSSFFDVSLSRLSEEALDNYLVFAKKSSYHKEDLLIPYVTATLSIDQQEAYKYWYIFKEGGLGLIEDPGKEIKQDFVERLNDDYVSAGIHFSKKVQQALVGQLSYQLDSTSSWYDPVGATRELSKTFPFLRNLL